MYARAFGAVEKGRHAGDDGRLMHVHLAVDGGMLLMHDDYPEANGGTPTPPPACVTLHLQVEDADVAWASALAAGCTVALPLKDQFWGDRYGQVIDPFGHRWSIGATIR